MTAVSPGVLILLGAALAVAVIMGLVALGRIPAAMEPPRDPWRLPRGRRRARGEDPVAAGVTQHAREPEILGASAPLDGPAPHDRPASQHTEQSGGRPMAAMKPRTGDGPLEVVREGRSTIMRVPLEGGGRLVVEISLDEAAELRSALDGVLEG